MRKTARWLRRQLRLGNFNRWRLERRLRRVRRLPPAWPLVAACLAGVIGSALLLLGLAYALGHGPAKSPAWAKALSATATKPAVAAGLGALLVLILGACFRSLRFERLARWPGPILVRSLAVPPGLDDVDVALLSSTFRQRLQTLRLQAPAPVPGATPAQDFLAMLDSGNLDVKNPLASVVRILRAATPTHAYEVSPALIVRSSPSDGKRYGVSAQVTRLPHGAIPIQTVWATSCEAAIKQAADLVTATVLPRTRLSHRPPWSGWRRYEMSPMLVHHFEQAQDLTGQRRYDEALNEYFSALKLDPKNVDLRLHLGMVQEKLGLALDAAATYAAAQRIATETDRSLYRLASRSRRKASGEIACYRLAVLLSGPIFARQWRKPNGTTLRAAHRERLRRRLEPGLMSLLQCYKLVPIDGVGHDDAAGPPPWSEAGIAQLLKRRGKEDDEYFFALRNVLAQLARKILRGVKRHVKKPWKPLTLLSPLTVELTIKWVELRRGYVQARLQSDGRGWLPPPERLTDQIPGAWLFRTWTEHYNAACLYALPLLVNNRHGPSEEERPRFADLAVDQLERAMSKATSVYAMSRRDWVLSEDPDLAGLRNTVAFKHFEAMYFPSASRTLQRPTELHRWEHSSYTHDLLSAAARRWEQTWHNRRGMSGHGTDPHTVLGWLTDEGDAWDLVRRVARDYRDSSVRYELIARMELWSGRYGFDPLQVGVPRFEKLADSVCNDDDRTESAGDHDAYVASLQKNVDALVGRNGERLRHIVTETEPLGEHRERLVNSLRDRDFWHDWVPQLSLPYVCDVQAALWQRLHEWIEQSQPGDAAHRAFIEAVAQATRLSSHSSRTRARAMLHRRLHPINGGRDGHGTGAGELVRYG